MFLDLGSTEVDLEFESISRLNLFIEHVKWAREQYNAGHSKKQLSVSLVNFANQLCERPDALSITVANELLTSQSFEKDDVDST